MPDPASMSVSRPAWGRANSPATQPGLAQQLVERHASAAIIGYPAVHHLTRELRHGNSW